MVGNPWCWSQFGGGMIASTFGLGWILSLVFFVLFVVGVTLLVLWMVRQS